MSSNLRFIIIYRSERKKILHSQLHLITYLQRVLERCDQSPSKEEFPVYYKVVTLTETEYEHDLIRGNQPGQEAEGEEEKAEAESTGAETETNASQAPEPEQNEPTEAQ